MFNREEIAKSIVLSPIHFKVNILTYVYIYIYVHFHIYFNVIKVCSGCISGGISGGGGGVSCDGGGDGGGNDGGGIHECGRDGVLIGVGTHLSYPLVASRHTYLDASWLVPEKRWVEWKRESKQKKGRWWGVGGNLIYIYR